MANRAERRALQFQPFSPSRESYLEQAEFRASMTGIIWQMWQCFDRDEEYADEQGIPSSQHWAAWEHQF